MSTAPGADPRVDVARTVELIIDTPSGEERETIDLAPGSTIEFHRNDGRRYSVAVDETLTGLALVKSKGART
jgi:hypothetical protein